MTKIEFPSFQNVSISHCCFLSLLKFINLFNKYLRKPLSVPGAVPGQVTIVVKTGKVQFLWSLFSSETDKM